jgi:NAD(P)-dependent dehydrogenase (short-subunit alcohol dehydrogenase family)
MLGVCFTPALSILEGTDSSARNGGLQLAPSCVEEWRAVIDTNLPSAFLAAK